MKIGKHLFFTTLSNIRIRAIICERWVVSHQEKCSYTRFIYRKYFKVFTHVRAILFLKLTSETKFSFVSIFSVAILRAVGTLMAPTAISTRTCCAMVRLCLKKTSEIFFEGSSPRQDKSVFSLLFPVPHFRLEQLFSLG